MFSRTIERVLLIGGLALCTFYGGVLAYREIGSRLALRSFAVAGVNTPASAETGTAGWTGAGKPDFSLWSRKRIAGYRDSLARHFEPPAGVLKIPKLHLEVPVFNEAGELALNRGVGWIAGTARLGEDGNIGIAGHRDGFFRGLKDIAVGDVLTLSSASVTTTYTVDQIRIVAPEEVSVLRARPAPSVTLVTCYPFYFTGAAPRRFIVHCSKRREERPNRNTGFDRTDKVLLNQFKEKKT